MSILVVCECGAKLHTSEANAGKVGRCPHCGRQFKCPTVEESAAYEKAEAERVAAEKAAADAAAAAMEAAQQAAAERAAHAGEGGETEEESPTPPSYSDSLLAFTPSTWGGGDDDEPVPDEFNQPEPKPEEPVERSRSKTKYRVPDANMVPQEPWEAVKTFDAQAGTITAMAFTVDGRFLATAGDDGAIKIYDLTSQTPPASLGKLDLPAGCLAFSPDGKRLAIGASRKREPDNPSTNLWVFDAVKKKVMLECAAHKDSVLALEFGPKSDVLMTGGDCLAEHNAPTLCVWDVAKAATIGGKAAGDEDKEDDPNAPVPDPFAVKKAGGPQTGFRPSDETVVKAIVRDGRGRFMAVACGSGMTIWRPNPPQQLVEISGGSFGAIQSLTESPDGHYLVGGLDGSLRVWDLPGERKMVGQLAGHDAVVRHCSFCFDNEHLVAVSLPEGEWSATQCKIWDVPTKEDRATLDPPNGSRIENALFIPGHRLVVTGAADGTVSIWKQTGKRRI